MTFKKVLGQIYRLKVPFEDLYTSVFLIKTASGNVLVDCATTSFDVNEYILPALTNLNLTIFDVKYLVLTHNHIDHAGGKNRLLELNSNIIVITEYSSNFINELSLYKLSGHVINCIGVFEKSTKTLITGDGLQGAGVGKYRTSICNNNEYLKTIQNIKNDKNVENILFSHAYEPWLKDGAFGRNEIETILKDCKKYIKE